MNDQLYEVRFGVEHYAQLINESLIDQESWQDMVEGAVALCLEFQDEPACSENPYLCSLLTTAIICVLMKSKDFVVDSDHVHELELVRSTKRALAEVISNIQDEVNECYPEGDD